MGIETFVNNAQTTLNGGIDNSQTSITVTANAAFPSYSYNFYRILVDGEIMLVTGGQGTNTWTVTRGVEGTANVSHNSGAFVTAIVTAQALNDIEQRLLGTPSTSSYNEEFDTALSGWTTLGTLDILNANTDIPSNLYMERSDSGSFVNGIYKAAPSMPFTVTCKLSDCLMWNNYHWTGLLLTESSPGKLFTFGPVYSNSVIYDYGKWTNRTTRASYADSGASRLCNYLRIVVTSSSSVSLYISENGLIFFPVWSNIDTGLTVANIGLFIIQWTGGTTPMKAAFDWIRFT